MTFLLWNHFLLSAISHRITTTWPTLKKLDAVWLSSAPGLQVCWMRIHQKYAHTRDNTTKALRNRTDEFNCSCIWEWWSTPRETLLAYFEKYQSHAITLPSHVINIDMICLIVAILSWIDDPVNVCGSSGLCGRRRVAYLAPELPLQLRPLLAGLAADSLGFALVQETPSPRDVTKVSTLCHVYSIGMYWSLVQPGVVRTFTCQRPWYQVFDFTEILLLFVSVLFKFSLLVAWHSLRFWMLNPGAWNT